MARTYCTLTAKLLLIRWVLVGVRQWGCDIIIIRQRFNAWLVVGLNNCRQSVFSCILQSQHSFFLLTSSWTMNCWSDISGSGYICNSFSTDDAHDRADVSSKLTPSYWDLLYSSTFARLSFIRITQTAQQISVTFGGRSLGQRGNPLNFNLGMFQCVWLQHCISWKYKKHCEKCVVSFQI